MKYILLFMCMLLQRAVWAQRWNTPAVISSSQLHERTIKKMAVNDSLNKVKFNRHLVMAEVGDVKDINAVGMCYFLGIGVAIDEAQALQWFQKAGEKGYPKAWYNAGIMYKYGKGTTVDHVKAYDYFSKAAAGNDPSGWYSQGYMLYKGLGCQQNYSAAYQLFRKGAQAGRPSCMYFTGLCLRNGYGVAQNADSARYWLMRAARLNYSYAKDELAATEAENNNQHDAVRNYIQSVQAAATPQKPGRDQFRQISTSLPAGQIEGDYTGYLVTYDYSNKFIVQSSTLKVNIHYNADNKQLTGAWTENENNTVNLKAILTRKGLEFTDMQYAKTDHYSPYIAKARQFETASLQYITKGDSVFLIGNIIQYLPESREPEKPILIALVKTVSPVKNDPSRLLDMVDADRSMLKLQAYPNPFNSHFIVDFNLPNASQVEIRIFSPDGKQVYYNKAGRLDPGTYRLPVQAALPNGTYILKLQYGKNSATTTLVKL